MKFLKKSTGLGFFFVSPHRRWWSNDWLAAN